jgi:GNAT superfamily N-acetyltransferase
MQIRPLEKEDLQSALDLVWVVFEEFEAPDYSEEGATSFKQFISLENILPRFAAGEMAFWGCFIEDDLAGVIATRGFNHISLLFVKKEFQRQGIARQLVKAVVSECKKKEDLKYLTVNSSPYAVEIYDKIGFVDTDYEQTIDGIRFTPMKLSL